MQGSSFISLNTDVLHWLNQSALTSSVVFNRGVAYLASANLFKGIPLMGLLWLVWHKFPDVRNGRRIMVMALMGCLVALFIARVLNNTIYHPRPFANAELHLNALAGMTRAEDKDLIDHNSFPSDHATLFFSLSTAVFLFSRTAGAFAFVYTFFLITLPRVYLGLHYPADILGGALLGIASVMIFTSDRLGRLYQQRYEPLIERYPAVFYASVFLVSLEAATLFADVRMIVKIVSKLLH